MRVWRLLDGTRGHRPVGLVLARLRPGGRLPGLLANLSANSKPPTSPTTYSTSRWRSGSRLLWGYCRRPELRAGRLFRHRRLRLRHHRRQHDRQRVGSAGRRARQPRRLRGGGGDLRLLRVLRPGADVDRPHPHPRLHLAPRDLPRPDGGLPMARRDGAARRLQRDDRHPVLPARPARVLRLPLLLLHAVRRGGLLPRLPDAGGLARRQGPAGHPRGRAADRTPGLRHPRPAARHLRPRGGAGRRLGPALRAVGQLHHPVAGRPARRRRCR